mmetsp:Transcript_39517/g.52095  ORF Transcript_39517/g.52095 Transcript_39517/m.52095 type:complete len:234 (-) Transcript_39517:4120-4821(-)
MAWMRSSLGSCFCNFPSDSVLFPREQSTKVCKSCVWYSALSSLYTGTEFFTDASSESDVSRESTDFPLSFGFSVRIPVKSIIFLKLGSRSSVIPSFWLISMISPSGAIWQEKNSRSIVSRVLLSSRAKTLNNDGCVFSQRVEFPRKISIIKCEMPRSLYLSNSSIKKSICSKTASWIFLLFRTNSIRLITDAYIMPLRVGLDSSLLDSTTDCPSSSISPFVSNLIPIAVKSTS